MQPVKDILAKWGVQFRFRCAYVPEGNGLIERSHRSIKTIAAKKQHTIMDLVDWYNVTPKGNISFVTATANLIHRYQVRLKGIDLTLPPQHRKEHMLHKIGDCGYKIRTIDVLEDSDV